MSHEHYEKDLALLKLKERLIDIGFEQINGAKFYNIDELDESLKNIIVN